MALAVAVAGWSDAERSALADGLTRLAADLHGPTARPDTDPADADAADEGSPR